MRYGAGGAKKVYAADAILLLKGYHRFTYRISENGIRLGNGTNIAEHSPGLNVPGYKERVRLFQLSVKWSVPIVLSVG